MEPLSVAKVIDVIDNTSVSMLTSVANQYLMDVEPAVVGIGSTVNFPDYNQVRGWTHWWRL